MAFSKWTQAKSRTNWVIVLDECVFDIALKNSFQLHKNVLTLPLNILWPHSEKIQSRDHRRNGNAKREKNTYTSDSKANVKEKFEVPTINYNQMQLETWICVRPNGKEWWSRLHSFRCQSSILESQFTSLFALLTSKLLFTHSPNGSFQEKWFDLWLK